MHLNQFLEEHNLGLKFEVQGFGQILGLNILSLVNRKSHRIIKGYSDTRKSCQRLEVFKRIPIFIPRTIIIYRTISSSIYLNTQELPKELVVQLIDLMEYHEYIKVSRKKIVLPRTLLS